MTVGLGVDELADMTNRFGVGEMQVRRDHAISHVLAAISQNVADRIIFSVVRP